MKPKQLFPAFIEFARSADEGVVELSDVYILPSLGVPLAESERSPFDWLALHLHYMFSDVRDQDANFYRRVLKELDTIKTEEQLRELLDIEEKYAAVELIGYEDQWARLEMIKKGLSDAIKKNQHKMRCKPI